MERVILLYDVQDYLKNALNLSGWSLPMSIFSKKILKSGFTLIELLIVMVIIAVLATIGLVTYSRATQNAKNSKAIGDMKAVQAAFEQTYTDSGGKYTSGPSSNACIFTNLENNAAPTEPTGIDYTINCNGAANTYCACTTLLGSANGGNANDGNCNGSSGSFFCVENKQ